jgi:hypothetical protein
VERSKSCLASCGMEECQEAAGERRGKQNEQIRQSRLQAN